MHMYAIREQSIASRQRHYSPSPFTPKGTRLAERSSWAKRTPSAPEIHQFGFDSVAKKPPMINYVSASHCGRSDHTFDESPSRPRRALIDYRGTTGPEISPGGLARISNIYKAKIHIYEQWRVIGKAYECTFVFSHAGVGKPMRLLNTFFCDVFCVLCSRTLNQM